MLERWLARMLSASACCVLAACGSSQQRQPVNLTPDTRLQVAEAAEAAGEKELALSMYVTAATSAPDNIALQLRCVDALARAGKIDQARALLTDRLKATAKQPDLMRALGLIDLVSGQPTEAMAELDKVLAVKPGDERSLADKAVALDLLHRHAEAQNIYRQLLTAAPNDAAVRSNFALSLMLEGKIREAQEQIATMRDLDSAPQRVKDNLGIIYAAAGDRERARQLLGDRISDNTLAALTQAIRTPATGRGNAF
jgi:Flp pilus assembly protein TadD